MILRKWQVSLPFHSLGGGESWVRWVSVAEMATDSNRCSLWCRFKSALNTYDFGCAMVLRSITPVAQTLTNCVTLSSFILLQMPLQVNAPPAESRTCNNDNNQTITTRDHEENEMVRSTPPRFRSRRHQPPHQQRQWKCQWSRHWEFVSWHKEWLDSSVEFRLLLTVGTFSEFSSDTPRFSILYLGGGKLLLIIRGVFSK